MVRSARRWFLALLLSDLLVFLPIAARAEIKSDLSPVVFDALQDSLEKPYLKLFETADGLEFNSVQIECMRTYLAAAEESCTRRFKKKAKQLGKDLRRSQAELGRRRKNLGKAERRELHCRIQNLRILHGQAEMFQKHTVPVAYANKLAKLELIEKWPGEIREIRRRLASGDHLNRPHGDVEDIGFREIAEGQEKDVKRGDEAVRQMKSLGLMPKEFENEEVTEYVSTLTRKVAAASDLRVPLRVTVLDSDEINAFALPGGHLYVHRGLVEAVEDESQLVGVLAHEIAHSAARHGHKLMKKATIASILYQAAQVSAIILTGGAVGIGTYYALQYGFYGLGLVLSLELLGVSREFELEADQLGVQYAWKSGYDPSGFIRFFDKMATTEGYIKGASWFRTHPPFYERMVQT